MKTNMKLLSSNIIQADCLEELYEDNSPAAIKKARFVVLCDEGLLYQITKTRRKS